MVELGFADKAKALGASIIGAISTEIVPRIVQRRTISLLREEISISRINAVLTSILTCLVQNEMMVFAVFKTRQYLYFLWRAEAIYYYILVLSFP